MTVIEGDDGIEDESCKRWKQVINLLSNRSVLYHLSRADPSLCSTFYPAMPRSPPSVLIWGLFLKCICVQ